MASLALKLILNKYVKVMSSCGTISRHVPMSRIIRIIRKFSICRRKPYPNTHSAFNTGKKSRNIDNCHLGPKLNPTIWKHQTIFMSDGQFRFNVNHLQLYTCPTNDYN